MNDATFTPQERRILFECEEGACPRCGRPRGYSVPDECDNNRICPQPWHIETELLLLEAA